MLVVKVVCTFRNCIRRHNREKEYLAKIENANLKLYFSLLDDFYEKWAKEVKDSLNEVVNDANDPKNKHPIKSFKPMRVIQNFHKYIERVPLVVQDKIAKGLADEFDSIGKAQIQKAIEKLASETNK